MKDRLESDLAFLQHALQNNFTKFLSYAVELAEVFQFVDYGPSCNRSKKYDCKISGNRFDPIPPLKCGPNKASQKESGSGGKVALVCFWSTKRSRVLSNC